MRIFLNSFSLSRGGVKSHTPSSVSGLGFPATSEACASHSDTITGDRVRVRRDGIALLPGTAVPSARELAALSGKTRASPWETSKPPPSSRRLSCPDLLTSPLGKDSSQGHGASSYAQDWEGVHLYTCLHTPLCPAAVAETRLPGARSHSQNLQSWS